MEAQSIRIPTLRQVPNMPSSFCSYQELNMPPPQLSFELSFAVGRLDSFKSFKFDSFKSFKFKIAHFSADSASLCDHSVQKSCSRMLNNFVVSPRSGLIGQEIWPTAAAKT